VNLGQAELISTVHVVPVQVRKLTWARSVLTVFLLHFKNTVYLCFLECAQLSSAEHTQGNRNKEWKLPERQQPWHLKHCFNCFTEFKQLIASSLHSLAV
jgi:hypothetical protein